MEPPSAGDATVTTSASVVGGLLLAIVSGGLLAWSLPITSIVLVWPILFFIPGWVVVRRVAPELPAPGTIGVAIVTSVYVSAHLVNVIARVDGFSRASIVLSAVVLATASLLFALLPFRWLAPVGRPTRARIVAASVRA